MKKIRETLREELLKDSDILYSAVVLDEKSKSLLFETYGEYIPEGWKKIGHHMTIAFGKGVMNKEDLNKIVELHPMTLGRSEMAMAVGVEGYQSNNKIPHITIAINPNGGKPVMSNDILHWAGLKGPLLTGVVTEVKKS